MAGLKVSILGPQIGKNCFFAPQFLGAHMNIHIGDKIFQDTSRPVAKFRENRPTVVGKSVVGKKDKTRPKYNSLPLYRWSDTRATVDSTVYRLGHGGECSA